MSITVKVSPVITLLGVDPKSVVKKYNDGYFQNLRLPPVYGKVKVGTSGVIRKVYSSNPEGQVFGFHSKSGLENVFVTTDHDKFTCIHVDGHYKKEGKCKTCGRYYNDRVMMGIPIRVTLEYRNGRQIPVYWCKGSFCSYECTLYRILEVGLGTNRRNVVYGSAESNLRMMFHLNYPQSGRLRPCNDPDLLNDNGGPIPYQEWVNHDHRYVETGNFVTYPAKTIYQLTS